MSRSTRSAIEWVAVIVGALVVALVVKTFLVQAFYIPSESMVPTLEVGDRVLVNKLSYRSGDISRGDVVVFARPGGAGADGIKDLIKRVIALPGETVEGHDDHVYINGKLLAGAVPATRRAHLDLRARAHPRGPHLGHGGQPDSIGRLTPVQVGAHRRRRWPGLRDHLADRRLRRLVGGAAQRQSCRAGRPEDGG